MTDPSPALVAVSSTTGLHLDLFDAVTGASHGRISDLSAQPHEIAWDAARRLMYLTHTYRSGGYGEGQEKSHEISVISPDAQRVVEVIDIAPFGAPHDVEYDPRRDLIYTGVENYNGRNGIVIIDAASREVVGHIPLSGPNAHWLALSPDGERLFVAHKEAPILSIVSLVERREIATVACAGGAEEIDYDAAGDYVYVATPLMNVTINVTQGALNRRPTVAGDPQPRLLKIDARSGDVVGALDFDEIICALTVAPNGDVLVSEMHFPAPNDPDPAPSLGRMHVVDSAVMSRRAAVTVGELPFTIRCTPDGRTAFVANLKSGTVSVVDLTANEVTATWANNVGVKLGGTHGLCYIPARDS
ncbi:MAG: putative surface layer protein [Subtercola sp.]|nr:putative surface layer protein [Subtercola sp.]